MESDINQSYSIILSLGGLMPFCSKCGKEVSEEDEFCYNCGKGLAKNQPNQKIPVTATEPVSKEVPQKGLTKGARFLFDLYYTTFQALVDAVGSKRALEFIEPYLKSHGDAAGLIMINRFKLKREHLFSLAVYIKFCSSIGWGVYHDNFQFFNHGFTSDVAYCPYVNSSEAFCRLSELQLNCTVPVMMNNFEYSHTRMLVKGDPYCQIMCKDKNYTLWGEIAKKPTEVPVPEISIEEKEFWQSACYSQTWVYATNALVDFAGKEKAVEIISPYMKALGKSTAVELFKELDLKDRNATSIALIINECNKAANQKGKYLTYTPDSVEREMTECIFASASQEICADCLEVRANGICEAINPEYEFKLTKRMCRGDKTCHWVIKKK